jgi:hypothetical protein
VDLELRGDCLKKERCRRWCEGRESVVEEREGVLPYAMGRKMS